MMIVVSLNWVSIKFLSYQPSRSCGLAPQQIGWIPMPKNVLILHASPRLNGNSQTLAETFAAGAEAAGHWVSRISLAQAQISPCQACGYCRGHQHRCRLEDDMDKIYPAILGADCVALAAPLYFYDWPAQLKLAIDRLYAFGPEYSIRDKETVLLMTAADQDPQSFGGAEATYQLALVDYLRWRDRGRILVGGLNEAGAIEGHPALIDAYKLGYTI